MIVKRNDVPVVKRHIFLQVSLSKKFHSVDFLNVKKACGRHTWADEDGSRERTSYPPPEEMAPLWDEVHLTPAVNSGRSDTQPGRNCIATAPTALSRPLQINLQPVLFSFQLKSQLILKS